MWGDFDPEKYLTPARQKMFRELDHVATEYPELDDLVARTKAEIKRLLVFEPTHYVLDKKLKPDETQLRAGTLYHGPDPLT